MASKKDVWIYSDPSVRVPYFLMKHDVWWDLSGSAVKLYLALRCSVKDLENGYRNVKEAHVCFGPSDMKCVTQRTYYRASNELLDVGLIEEVMCGSHGKKAVYDLMSVKWMSYRRKVPKGK